MGRVDKAEAVRLELPPRRIIRMDLIEEKFKKLEDRGILYLGSAIDEGMSSVVSMTLFKLHMDLDKDQVIWIMLNSPGGRVDQGFAVYDTIKALTSNGRKINILCMGCVASMATCILQAGTERLSLPNTQFLIHEISQFIYDNEKVSESEERVTESKRINQIVMSLIAKRIGMSTEKLIATSKKKDYWLDAKSALKFGDNGLIDKVTTIMPF
ncbi:MAG: hypothetical protein A3F98_01995 [Candidatus Yanofskybacteria bacterium RIFCSPLOWO2_12_FULL_41_8]|nr:MAG: hypothetical protein A3F98_01995 [Candidatus Yanofskybacteria bacterium RIFCSPLOWO2_12_FULL_41_8]